MTSKGTTRECLPPSVWPTLVMFLILTPAVCSAIEVNCSDPSSPAMLKDLRPIFNLSAIRPVMNMSTCTNVSVYFTLYGILGVDEKAQLLITYIWLGFKWKNEFVSWDPVQCGINRISLPRNKFWVPDIVINEFMDEDTAPPVPYVHLYSDGYVRDNKPVRVVSSCNLNIYTFPFDIQNCTFTFNSYIHTAMDIKILLERSTEDITQRSKKVMTTMGEWELLDITSNKHSPGPDELDQVDALAFHIRVRRRATLYVVNLLIPSCFLITVDLFSFLLPLQSVDRSSFKMTLILGYTVFLLIMNDLLPVTGNAIPLINVFFSLCLALMVASLVETIFITNLLNGSADFSPVPHWIRVFVLQILGYLVCLPQKTKEPKVSDIKLSTVVAQQKADKGPAQEGPAQESKALQELKRLGRDLQAIRLRVEQQLGRSKSSEEWIQVGFIIERLLFALYILFISVSFITIISVWCCPLKVKPSKLLFISISLLMHASFSSSMLNCSQPDPLSLLEALRPVFNMTPVRPVMNMSTPVDVSISFILFGILGVDEKAQVLTTFIWETMEWRNEFVKWDPEKCGSTRITIPRKLFWVPDIVINEFMEKNTAPYVPYTYLYSDGLMRDAQPVKVVSSCSLDIYTFPFDIQNCTLSFNSYTHSSREVQIFQAISSETIFKYSKEVMTTMGEWELVGLTAEKYVQPGGGGGFYHELRFFVSVRRRATLYVVNLLIPSCFLITVDLFSFLLPPKSVDRSLFKMTLILGYTVFLLIMNDLLPVSGDTIPLMNVFLSLCLAMMVASLLETIIITNLLYGSAQYPPVPHWLQVIVLHFLGRLVGLPPKPRDRKDTVIKNPAAKEIKVSSMEAQDTKVSEQEGPLDDENTLQELRSLGRDLKALHLQVEQRLGESQNLEEWIQFGFVIDRLLFALYILFISVSFITIIIIWMNSYSTS